MPAQSNEDAATLKGTMRERNHSETTHVVRKERNHSETNHSCDKESKPTAFDLKSRLGTLAESRPTAMIARDPS